MNARDQKEKKGKRERERKKRRRRKRAREIRSSGLVDNPGDRRRGAARRGTARRGAQRRWTVKRGIYGGSCGEDNIVRSYGPCVYGCVSEISRETKKGIAGSRGRGDATAAAFVSELVQGLLARRRSTAAANGATL